MIDIRKSAFTLAEVLVTLGIIGVVAALTIPPLLNQSQDREFRSQMSKEYSVLTQAHNAIKAENGSQFVDSILSCIPNNAAGHTCLKDLYKDKYAFIKECDANSVYGNCFAPRASVKYLNGNANNGWFLNSDTAAIVLKDGASLMFYLDRTTNCTNSNRCGWVTIDVNGAKNPNVWGRDVYLFFIYPDIIRPSIAGVIEPAYATADDCNTGTNLGLTCASKYLLGS